MLPIALLIRDSVFLSPCVQRAGVDPRQPGDLAHIVRSRRKLAHALQQDPVKQERHRVAPDADAGCDDGVIRHVGASAGGHLLRNRRFSVRLPAAAGGVQRKGDPRGDERADGGAPQGARRRHTLRHRPVSDARRTGGCHGRSLMYVRTAQLQKPRPSSPFPGPVS